MERDTRRPKSRRSTPRAHCCAAHPRPEDLGAVITEFAGPLCGFRQLLHHQLMGVESPARGRGPKLPASGLRPVVSPATSCPPCPQRFMWQLTGAEQEAQDDSSPALAAKHRDGRHDTSCCAGPHSRSRGSRRSRIGGETNSRQDGRGQGSSRRRRWKMWMIASWTGRTTVAIRVSTVVRSLRVTGRISGADGVPSLVVTAIRAS
jgi:hypothetical protein